MISVLYHDCTRQSRKICWECYPATAHSNLGLGDLAARRCIKQHGNEIRTVGLRIENVGSMFPGILYLCALKHLHVIKMGGGFQQTPFPLKAFVVLVTTGSL